MGLRILILSRGRSATIARDTCSVLPDDVEVLVPESERDQYAREIPNPLLTVPDDVEGLGRLRNWVLDNIQEESVVMVDDDITSLYQLDLAKSRNVRDRDEALQVLVNAWVMARDAGAGVFGFSQTDIRKYKGTDPFSLCSWVGGVIGVIGRRLRFRDDPFKVDIDFCLQNLLVNRMVWVDNRYFWWQHRDNNSGGNAQYRTESAYERSIETLKDKWGDLIKVRTVKNQKRITLNVERKQEVRYE